MADTLVPFGMENTPAGPRAWALGNFGAATVILTGAPDGGWTRSGDPIPDTEPVGGTRAPQHAGEMTADGHGAVLLADRGPSAAEARLFVRAPRGAFEPSPPVGAALLAGERLVADPLDPSARALLAAIGGDATTAGALVVPTDGDGRARAVLQVGRGGWTREPIERPPNADPLTPVAIAAGAPEQAWLLARDGPATAGGDRPVLLRRVAGAPPRWVPVDIPPAALAGGLPHPAGVDRVTVAGREPRRSAHRHDRRPVDRPAHRDRWRCARRHGALRRVAGGRSASARAGASRGRRPLVRCSGRGVQAAARLRPDHGQPTRISLAGLSGDSRAPLRAALRERARGRRRRPRRAAPDRGAPGRLRVPGGR